MYTHSNIYKFYLLWLRRVYREWRIRFAERFDFFFPPFLRFSKLFIWWIDFISELLLFVFDSIIFGLFVFGIGGAIGKGAGLGAAAGIDDGAGRLEFRGGCCGGAEGEFELDEDELFREDIVSPP